MGAHQRKRHCETCGLFNSEHTMRVPDGRQCDLCEIFEGPIAPLCINRKNGHRWSLMAYVPLEVQEFFQTDAVCWVCCNRINTEVRTDLGLCWATASYDALKLAFVRVIRKQFGYLAHADSNQTRWRNDLRKMIAQNGDTEAERLLRESYA